MSVLSNAYGDLLAELKAALADSELRVADDISAAVDASTVVLGPPTFRWEGMCDPGKPTSMLYDVYLVERADERAVERLLDLLPDLIDAVLDLGHDTVIEGDATPAAFPNGSTELPAYRFSAETTL